MHGQSDNLFIHRFLLFFLLVLHFVQTPSFANENWFAQGQAHVTQALQLQPQLQRAKRIILFIGDGMGISTVTAARILQGQQQGQSGEENQLSFEHFPYLALSKTYNTNQQTPDSAGTMSAIMTGEKTKAESLQSVKMWIGETAAKAKNTL